MMPLRHRVGQLLIVGVEGATLSAPEKAWLRTIEPGGIILFRRNIESAAQTYRLLASANALGATPLLRCVDVEGGLVDRLRDVIAPMPSLAAVAASGDRALYRKHGKLIGREARCLGFNTVFAPVLDLRLPESQSVMKTRTYFDTPQQVIEYAGGVLGGLNSAGVLGCGKHFPGLGGGTLDSHHATPIIERSWETLWHNDLLPYRKLHGRLPMIMVSHASYPLTPDGKPASISPFWITKILTKRLKYGGLIVSDDMEMGGILKHTSIEDAVVQAVLAGTYLVEVCKDAELVHRAYEALLAEAERSAAFRSMVKKASSRIFRAKRAWSAGAMKTPPSLAQVRLLRSQVLSFRERLPEPVCPSSTEAAR